MARGMHILGAYLTGQWLPETCAGSSANSAEPETSSAFGVEDSTNALRRAVGRIELGSGLSQGGEILAKSL